MRLAVVCPYAWDRFGGVQSHVRALSRMLSQRGHEVEVLVPVAGLDERLPGVRVVGHTVPVPANGSVAPVAFGPVTAMEMKRALMETRPEVIHLHEPLIPSLSLLALLNATVPAIGTFHAAADSSIGYRASRRMLERAARRLTVRTAVSDAAGALASRYFPGDYALTPNGVDVARFAAAEPLDLGVGRGDLPGDRRRKRRSRGRSRWGKRSTGRSPGGKVVLFLGRLERRKGLEVLIQAMTALGDLDARLVVCGRGPEEGAARRLARRLRVDATFLGPLDDEELAGAYKAADLYCAPGLGGESFGIVLLEAMAAGTPVICSDIPAFRTVARGAALLVPPGHPGALADAIRRVLTDEPEARRMSVAGSRVAAPFDWARLVGNVESLYARALEEGAQRLA